MKKHFFYIALSFFIVLNAKAQDIHHSQFFENPLYESPAMTGNFQGNYRFGGIYRNQWESVTTPYRTFGFFSDAKDLLLKHKFSPGAYILTDKTGDSRFSTLVFNLCGNYHIYQSPDSIHSVYGGINIGLTQRSINYSALSFDNQYNGFYYDPSLNTGENFGNNGYTYFNSAIGFLYTYQPQKGKSVSGGFAIHNINGANQSFFNTQVNLARRWSFYANGVYPINSKIDVLPSFLLQKQGTYNETIFGARGKYKTNSMAAKALYAGIFYRNKDAGFIEAGLDYNNWHGSISYDLNLSNLHPASLYRGGIEIALSYIISIYHPKFIMHKSCPDYL